MPAGDQALVDLIDLTSSIVDRLTGPQPSDAEIRVVYEDLAKASQGWTALAEQGRLVEVSKPFANAMAQIIVGFDTRQQSQVNEGIQLVMAVAREVDGRD